MSNPDPQNVSRRDLLQGTLGVAAAAALSGAAANAGEAVNSERPPGATKGNINQSVIFWCFNVAGEKWSLDKTCEVAKSLGCKSVELVEPEDWGTLKKHGLTCAVAPNGMPGAPFMKGLNNKAYHEEVITRTKKVIEQAGEADIPSVIAFTGYKYRDAEDPTSEVISIEEGTENCIAGLKQLAPFAEKHGVTIVLEHLNTRDDTHPMKGHPGYQGDDIDQVADMLRAVEHERIKLLFDCYHVQVMNGDVIRRIHQMKDIIGHIHVAGCPGRGELDDTQEMLYPPIMQALVDIGYKGFVGQEFIPTRDPLQGLAEAVTLCDV